MAGAEGRGSVYCGGGRMSLGRVLWLPGGPGSCVPLDSPVWS